jgi:hypothetical protein
MAIYIQISFNVSAICEGDELSIFDVFVKFKGVEVEPIVKAKPIRF